MVPLLLDWFARNARDLPWRHVRDPYAIWVSEIMLQQTQVRTVIPYWERWMRELPTIASLAQASPETIHKLWEGLGYYTRVRNLQKAAQIIQTAHRGEFPRTFDEVLALPGIGRYTAGAICSIAFNQPTPILDGNVIRVLTRLLAIEQNPRDKAVNTRLWQLAGELVLEACRLAPSRARISRTAFRTPPPASALNQSLMELGALICTPRSPQCLICPLRKVCQAREQNRVEAFPNLGKRTAATERRFAAFVVRQGNTFLVRQRPPGVVNAHLWEFPNLELGSGGLSQAAAALPGGRPKTLQPLCTIKHSITRYRITLEAHLTHLAAASPTSAAWRKLLPPGGGRWLTLQELKRLSFPSAHRKILSRLEDSLSRGQLKAPSPAAP